MGLPEKYDRRLKDNLGLRAVWLPGSDMELGAVLQREDGVFQPIAHLKEFGVSFSSKKITGNLSLTFQANGVSCTVFQAGGEVNVVRLDPKADAELKIEFKRADTYFVRTPRLTGVGITDLLKVSRAVKRLPDWHHGRYHIAWRVYRAGQFVFLGSSSKKRTIRFAGSGGAILDFLNLGVSAKVERMSAKGVNIEIMGVGGPTAMNVARIRSDGRIIK